MRDILIFAIGASIVGTIFLVSLIELIFTIRRRKIMQALDVKVKEMKTQFNDSMNKMVLDQSSAAQTNEQKLTELNQQIADERAELETEYQEKVGDIKKNSLREVNSAKERARKMQHEAELKAEEYLATRKKQVEAELMDLVLSVSKKVLPASISYEAHKELVMQSLKEIKSK